MSHVADLFASLLEHRKVDGDAVNNAIVDALALALADAFERLGAIAFGIEAQPGYDMSGTYGEGTYGLALYAPVPDTDAVDGSRVLRDPSVAPLWALAHAAMYVGAKLPGRMPGESDYDYLMRARDVAAYPFGIRRGTHEAVRRAIKAHLTGTQTVIIEDNYGSPYDIYVRTQADETPDPVLVQRLLEGDFVSGGQPGAIRAELSLTYVTADYPAWPEGERAWDAVADGVTWSNVHREDIT